MVANKQEHHHHHHRRQHRWLWAFGAISVSRKKKDGMGLPNLNTPSITLDHGGKQGRASSPSSSPSTSYCSLLIAHCLLLAVYCCVTAYCLLLTAYRLLLTAYCLLLTGSTVKEVSAFFADGPL